MTSFGVYLHCSMSLSTTLSHYDKHLQCYRQTDRQTGRLSSERVNVKNLDEVYTLNAR